MDIIITKEIEKFKTHIEIQNNTRVFFSGIFGIGKTYFLKEFFKKNSDIYESIVLQPVNYSIASNEDIINYIKYDILFELIGKNIDFEKTDISKYLSAQYYIKDNFIQVASIIAKMSGKIGKPIANILDGLQKLNENIEKHNEKNQVDQKKEVIQFLKKIKEKEGSIYEENNITELISALVQSLKENDNKEFKSKKTVLIIDDLDRLDPEHIFRILNVFACHFDLGTSDENKFGFDKIIIVGDTENIRNIFHAKYGMNTDFNGYIDKFFSYEIYQYHNKSALKECLHNYIKNLKTGQKLSLENPNSLDYIFLLEILTKLVEYNLFSIRTIKSSCERPHETDIIHFKGAKENNFLSNYNVLIIQVFQLLASIFGSISNAEVTLQKLSKKNPLQVLSNLYLLNPIIMILDYENHLADEGKYKYNNSNFNIQIEYYIENNYRNINLKVKKVSFLNNPEKESPNEKESHNFPFAPLLHLAFQKFLNLEEKY